VEGVTGDIERYQLGEAGRKVYEFLWDDFADWYIEASKTRLYEGAGGGDERAAEQSKKVLVYVLDRALRILHPYMPFVTEMLWHHLPKKEMKQGQAAHSLMLSDWPMLEGEVLFQDDAAVKEFETFQMVVKSVRNARAEYKVEQGAKVPADIIVGEGGWGELFEKERNALVLLARLEGEQVRILQSGSAEAEAVCGGSEGEMVRLVVQDGIEVYLPMSGLIDKDKELERLTRQEGKLRTESEKLRGRLEGKGFVDKAPEKVVEKAREELRELESQLAKVVEGIAKLS